MKKINLLFFTSILWVCAENAFASAPEHTEKVGDIEVPSIESIKDASSKCGLNLALIQKRRELLHNGGIHQDISINILILQNHKAAQRIAIEERIILEKTLSDLQFKTSEIERRLNSKENFTLRSQKKDVLVKEKNDYETEISSLKKKITHCVHDISTNHLVIKRELNNVAKTFGLSASQVSQIPAADSADSVMTLSRIGSSSEEGFRAEPSSSSSEF